jgi:hypothetical protein
MALEAFFSTEAALAVYGVVIVMLADFALGVFAAFRDNTFQLDTVAAFLRKHAAGRVGPITVMLMLGYFGNQPALTALGLASAAAYTVETIGSITSSLSTRSPQDVPVD